MLVVLLLIIGSTESFKYQWIAYFQELLIMQGGLENVDEHKCIPNSNGFKLRLCSLRGQSGLSLVSSRACHRLLVPSGCPVTVSICLTATAAVGARPAVAVFAWRESHEEELRAWSGCSCPDAVSGGSTGREGVLLLTPTSLGCWSKVVVLGPGLCSCYDQMIMWFLLVYSCVVLFCHTLCWAWKHHSL